MDHVSEVGIQFKWQHKQKDQQKAVENWIIFMQIECINKSLVAFNSIDDIFM